MKGQCFESTIVKEGEYHLNLKAVIMAGGKGTRIASVNSEIPKPMIPMEGKPVLEHQIECLRAQGITEYIFVVGHLYHAIKGYFGNGRKFSVHIDYLIEDSPLGTAGALLDLQDRLQGDFLLLNGDIIFDINVERFLAYHRAKGGLATIFTHPNDHPYDSALVEVNGEGLVTGWRHKEEERGWYQNRVNAGLHLFSDDLFSWMREKGLLSERRRMDLDRDILKCLLPERKLYAYDSPEYVKDMGTPERWRSVSEDIHLDRVRAKNLSLPQRAVFLDRDGTINEYRGFLTDIEEFHLLPGAGEAIRLLNRTEVLVILVTNQPVIARGEVTEEQLEEIHRKMETLLGAEGAYVDAIYYCPHHPDSGFAGEIPELKRACDCRKPKPGMLLQAADDYHIDLAVSWMVGDQKTDIQAGKNAGCHTAGVYGAQGENGTFPDLLSFARWFSEQDGPPRKCLL